jgi:PAS domain S-box-containing protein
LDDVLLDDALAGGGRMGEAVRAFDWGSTSLGPVSSWPLSLRAAVGIVLSTRHPMCLWWGPDLIQLYNDAYQRSLGSSVDPEALGRPGRACWPEPWSETGDPAATLGAGEATWYEDRLVPISRSNQLEDAYWTYSCSRVGDEPGMVGGVVMTVLETTRRVLGERRADLLRRLAAEEMAARSPPEACQTAIALLSRQPDLSFVRLYLRDRVGGGFGLQGQAGTVPPGLADSRAMNPEGGGAWPIEAVLAAVGPVVIRHWAGDQAMLLPLRANGHPQAVDGILAVGVSPRLPLDPDCRAFLGELAGQIGRSVGSAQARADAERHERALQDEVARLGALFQAAPGFLAVMLGPDHVFELVNPAYRQLIGHRDAVGRPVREAVPEVEGQGFFELLDEVYRTGKPFTGSELRMQLQREPSGPLEEHYFDFAYQAMRDSEGAIRGVLATGYDVTELVRSRNAAMRVAAERDAERRKLLTVLAQSPLAIFIAEAPTGRVIYANPKVAELFGGDVSSAPPGIFHPDGRPLAPEEWPVTRALQHGEAVELETVRVERPGRRRTLLSVNAAPVRGADGRIIAAVAFLRDVTAERRREQQLRDAQRLQSVGTLAGGVAHEINNQMTVVLSFGEFILEALGPGHSQTPDMQVVIQAGRRAARVSQQLLAFTRQQVFQPRDVALADLTAELLPVLRQLLGRDKILEMAPAAPTRRVRADPSQLQQVLINLVANARDALGTGGRVTIAVEDVTHPGAPPDERGFAIRAGEYVQLTVTDTGHGMDRATLARVFEPFYTTKRVGEGTGLGLSMVYGIVKQHGGYIEADSTPGRGTVFRLYLPALVDRPPAAAPAGPGEEDARGSASRGSATVVVVEDDEAVQALVIRTLKRLGYTVLAAGDGTAALELVRTTPAVSLVITDVIMPELNGRQLHDALAELRPDVPVLYMSGYSAEAAALRELVPPGAPFLQKPFTTAELAEAVDALVEARR